jgi:uncharacterized protein YjiS (DUF1127 family)
MGFADAFSAAAIRLVDRFNQFLARRRRAAEARRLTETLAALSDSSLLDIGIAEDEIYRVRNCEQFTPRAWRDERGLERCCGA